MGLQMEAVGTARFGSAERKVEVIIVRLTRRTRVQLHDQHLRPLLPMPL